MDCCDVRKWLYPTARPDLELAQLQHPVEMLQARLHRTRCRACNQFFDAEEHLRLLVKRRAPRVVAGDRLKRAVLGNIVAQNAPVQRAFHIGGLARRPVAIHALISVLVVIAVVASLWVAKSDKERVNSGTRQLVTLLVDDYAKPSNPLQIETSNAEAVQSWFQSKVDFAVGLPDVSKASLLGARRCNLKGRAAALVFYRSAGNSISLFVLDGSDIELSSDGLIRLEGKNYFVDSQKEFNVVMWKVADILYGLVSDGSRADLLEIAGEF